jgi:hypothetical protein
MKNTAAPIATCFHAVILLGVFDPEDLGSMFPETSIDFQRINSVISQKIVLFRKNCSFTVFYRINSFGLITVMKVAGLAFGISIL